MFCYTLHYISQSAETNNSHLLNQRNLIFCVPELKCRVDIICSCYLCEKLQIEAQSMYYINKIKVSMDQAEINSFVTSFAQAMQLEQSQ